MGLVVYVAIPLLIAVVVWPLSLGRFGLSLLGIYVLLGLLELIGF